jgi:hypothetical protein
MLYLFAQYLKISISNLIRLNELDGFEVHKLQIAAKVLNKFNIKKIFSIVDFHFLPFLLQFIA